MTRATEVIKNMSLNSLAQLSTMKGANDHMSQLVAFHHTYAMDMAPLGSQDKQFLHMNDDRVRLRAGLIVEEVKELLEDGLGMVSPNNFITGLAPSPVGERNGAEVADALGDIVYLCYGFALELGYDLRNVLAEIHAANLTKLGADGKPIYREDGKVLKGPNYHAPNIPAALGWELSAASLPLENLP